MKKTGAFLVALSVVALVALFLMITPKPAEAEQLQEEPACVIPASQGLCIVITIQQP